MKNKTTWFVIFILIGFSALLWQNYSCYRDKQQEFKLINAKLNIIEKQTQTWQPKAQTPKKAKTSLRTRSSAPERLEAKLLMQAQSSQTAASK